MACHNGTAAGRYENPTKGRHRLIRLHTRRVRNTRLVTTSNASAQASLPSEARLPVPTAKPNSRAHRVRHTIRARRADRRNDSGKREGKCRHITSSSG